MNDDLRLWALGGLLAVLLPVFGWILVQFVASIKELSRTVSALKLAVEEVRLWATDRFVSQKAYDRDLESVWADLEKAREACERRHREG